MAKKTAKKSAAKKAPATKTKAPKTAKKKAAASSPAPALTDHMIGESAGEVWAALVEAESLTLAALKKTTSCSGEATLMGVGWLAREGKLKFDTEGRTVKISLA